MYQSQFSGETGASGIYRQRDGQVDRRMDEQVGGQVDGQVGKEIDGQLGRSTDEWIGRQVIYFKEMAHAVTESGKSAGWGQQARDTAELLLQFRCGGRLLSFPSSLGEAGLCSVQVFT